MSCDALKIVLFLLGFTSAIATDTIVREVSPSGNVSRPSQVHGVSSAALQTTNDVVEVDTEERWSNWTVSRECSNDCGACGRIQLSRRCLCSNCTCSGNRETRIEICGTAPCKFPRPTCCKGFRKDLVDRKFVCVAVDQFEPSTRGQVCVGSWSEWKQDTISTCSDSCGMCGKRRSAFRECVPKGCECSGDDSLFESCAPKMCKIPRKPCCDGFHKGWVDRKMQCVEGPIQQVKSRDSLGAEVRKKINEQKDLKKQRRQIAEALRLLDGPIEVCEWSEWEEIPQSECSAKCGMCGVREAARRQCRPFGCKCVGAAVRYEDCGSGLCPLGKPTCCGKYVKMLIHGTFSCVDPLATNKIDKPPPAILRDAVPSSEPIQIGLKTCRGVWSPFERVPPSDCSDTCGMCGERVVAARQCLPEGCVCEGSSKLREKCAEKPCAAPKHSCCKGARLTLVDGKHLCKEEL